MSFIVRFTYKNYRGEVSEREVAPEIGSLQYGSNEYHPEPQYLISGWDMQKNARRTFAMKDISNWRTA